MFAYVHALMHMHVLKWVMHYNIQYLADIT